jgi:hypothetical protein
MTPTYLNGDYGLLAIGLPWHGALNLELQRELVRGIPNPASITKRDKSKTKAAKKARKKSRK